MCPLRFCSLFLAAPPPPHKKQHYERDQNKPTTNSPLLPFVGMQSGVYYVCIIRRHGPLHAFLSRGHVEHHDVCVTRLVGNLRQACEINVQIDEATSLVHQQT